MGEARWKLKTLLRSSAYHTDADLVALYKARLLSFLEYRTAAVYHATSTTLGPLDKVQEKLLNVVGCTSLDALFFWNLAPLNTRRDVAMLGLVHRAVLGLGPKHFQRFFRQQGVREVAHWTRGATRRHHLQLEEGSYANCPELLRRSALGLVKVYNLLPQHVVSADSVRSFQRKVQDLMKSRAAAECEDWHLTLSPRVP